jgi:serine acetyltransferase/glycosyltransferase involved in cell wall biosynthesis
VVIPAFNAESTIEATILSAQRSGADEVIVVDDGSTDGTAVLAAAHGCVVIGQKNAGAAAARRAGIHAVRTDKCILLDSDDAVIPLGVSRSVRMLDGDLALVMAQGVTIGIGAGGSEKRLRAWPEDVTTQSLLHRGHASGPPGAFVWRTSALEHVIGDNPQGLWPRYAEDFELLIRGSMLGPIGQHDEDACLYQWTGGKSGKAPKRSVGDAELIRRHYSHLTGIPIEKRTDRQLNSLVWMRRRSPLTRPGDAPRRSVYLALALANDPGRFASKMSSLWRGRSDDDAATNHEADMQSFAEFYRTLRADWSANPRDPKSQLVVLGFRVTQFAMGNRAKPRLISIPFVIAYRLMTEFGLGIELRPKTQVGSGLSIFHGTGLVVNDHAVIGKNVTLRNGVTIGHQKAGGGSPVIEDNVVVGASALILGEITVGEGAIIGAGSVVTKSVDAFTTVAGNPARVISTRSKG